jgi:hypothetical protein
MHWERMHTKNSLENFFKNLIFLHYRYESLPVLKYCRITNREDRSVRQSNGFSPGWQSKVRLRTTVDQVHELCTSKNGIGLNRSDFQLQKCNSCFGPWQLHHSFGSDDHDCVPATCAQKGRRNNPPRENGRRFIRNLIFRCIGK